MSIHDEFRVVAAELMAEFAVNAKLVRIHERHNKRTDKTALHEEILDCRAVITPRKIKTEDGVLTTQTMATMSIRARPNDRLIMGGAEYTVEFVEEVAPDGKPVIWIAKVAT